MGVSTIGWKNKIGTSNRNCVKCGSWKDHWCKHTSKSWPMQCSVENCVSPAAVGAHVIHSDIVGERIVPMCTSCNGGTGSFNLKGGTSLGPAQQCS